MAEAARRAAGAWLQARKSVVRNRRRLYGGWGIVWTNSDLGTVELMPVEVPGPARGEVTIEVLASAVSPRDRTRLLPAAPARAAADSVQAGYSAAGVVVSVGAGVEGLRPGDRVAATGAPHASGRDATVIQRPPRAAGPRNGPSRDDHARRDQRPRRRVGRAPRRRARLRRGCRSHRSAGPADRAGQRRGDIDRRREVAAPGARRAGRCRRLPHGRRRPRRGAGGLAGHRSDRKPVGDSAVHQRRRQRRPRRAPGVHSSGRDGLPDAGGADQAAGDHRRSREHARRRERTRGGVDRQALLAQNYLQMLADRRVWVDDLVARRVNPWEAEMFYRDLAGAATSSARPSTGPS